MASVLILKNANIYAPEPRGVKDILCIEGRIAKIGTVHLEQLKVMEIPYEVYDLEGAIVFPGIIDPHEHIIGGSGERGYRSRSPEITIPELIAGGITTVVGCIGVDTITRNMFSLLAQAKFYNEEGLTAYIWSGGYPIPPKTLTGSIEKDMILVHEVIGLGEVALSDYRSSEPALRDLAREVAKTYNGGILTGKSGVTHFHMGNGKYHLQPVLDLLNEFDIKETCLYPTHVNRNPEILKQGALATHQGITIDFDCSECDLVSSLESFIDHNGDFNFITLSSDASFSSPATLLEQVKAVIKHFKWPLEKILPLITTNTARILKLDKKGRIEVGADADFVSVDPGSFNLLHVVAGGRFFMREGHILYHQKILDNSNRKIEIYGKKNSPG